MRYTRTILLKSILLLLFSLSSFFAYAGVNIDTKSGLISNINQDDGLSSYVDIYINPPKDGLTYVVKVNFLKVETSAKALDAYCETVNKRTGKEGSLIADTIREYAKENKSKADLFVFDSKGNNIDYVSNLSSLTVGKKAIFKAIDSTYIVRIKCLQGAGLYHFVFENK